MSRAQMWVLNNLNRTMVYWLATTALFIFTVGASAQTADEKICFTLSGDPAIEACNRIINSGAIHGDHLAIAYYNRSVEWSKTKDLVRALTDMSQAIRIDRKYTAAYAMRGNFHERTGDINAARAVYRKALSVPAKYNTGKSGHDYARQRLSILNSE